MYPWYCAITWNYYAGDTIAWSTVPPLSDLRTHRYDLLKEQMTRDDQPQIVAPVTERIRETLMAGKRVWVVGGLPTAPPGREVPILPPAPLSKAKWSGGAYEAVWGMQIGRFLQEHATRWDRVAVELNQPVNRFEDLSLVVLSGWRN